jgi:hypothetical protein
VDTTCGIGDFIKFFMFALSRCKTRLLYKKQNLEVEKYIQLKHPKMYFAEPQQILNPKLVDATMYYETFNDDFAVGVTDVFYFSNEVNKVPYTILCP